MATIVDVLLTNRVAKILPSDDFHSFVETEDALSSFWSFQFAGARFDPRFKHWLAAVAQFKQRLAKRGKLTADAKIPRDLPGWDGKIRYLKRNSVPAGLFRATRKEAEETLNIRFHVTRKLPHVSTLPVADSEEKYRFQDRCARRMLKNIHRGGGVVLSATATGKTAICGKFFAAVPQLTCLFIVNTIDLLYQSAEEIGKWAQEGIGIVGNSKYDVAPRIVCATIQTLAKHLKDPKFVKWYSTVQVMVVDEVHEQLPRRNFKVLESVAPIACFGLTATLQLGKKEVRTKVHAFCGPILFEFPIAEAIEQEVVSSARVLQLRFPCTTYDEDGTGGDYQEEYASQVVANDLKLLACRKIVDYLLQEDRYVLVLCDRIDHINRLHDVMPLPHALAYGKITTKDRKASRDAFEAGNCRLLIANSVFKRGINLKRLDAIIDMSEMRSKNDAMQKLGRGVRLHHDKEELLYIDFGTQDGFFYRACASRASAFRKSLIPTTKKQVSTPEQAVQTVANWMAIEAKDTVSGVQPSPIQGKLALASPSHHKTKALSLVQRG